MKNLLHTLVLLFLSFVLVACFGGGGGGGTATYTIGGHVTNLSGSGLVIQNNGSDNLAITANDGFTFPTAMADGSSYNVTILTQPIGQTCMVSYGSGTISGADVATVYVGCNDNNTIGGTVSGLSGTVVLQNNNTDDLSLTADRDFTFSTDLAYGTGYNVTVLTQPTGQTCTIFNASGIVAGADVVNVSVVCVTNYNIGGTVSGLVGTGLVLQNKDTNNLSITTNGDFTFTTTIIDGTDYSVTVLNQPTSPSQTCSISDGSGTVGGGDITNVTVTCITNSYSIGVTVSGLTGTGLVLQNNDTNNLSITANGDFTFTATIIDGNDYNVTVLTHPTGQVCPVTGNSGTVSGANVTDIMVTCLTPPGDIAALYSINGSSWNDYVVDDGASFTQATDTACNADTDTACLHGGELRVFDVTDKSSCTGLTAKDSLEVFDWNCDISTGTVRFISTGLKDGKGLSDLMDFTTPGWKENSLAIYDGQNIHTASSSTVWWSNVVIVDNDGNDGTTMSAGEIYVITADPAAIYTLGVDSVALVIKPGVTLTGTVATGENVVSANTRNFLWVEGEVNAAGDTVGVYWDTVKFSVMRELTADYADTGAFKAKCGIYLYSSSNNTLSGVTASNNISYGVYLDSSSDNTLTGVKVSNNDSYGVYLDSSSNNKLSGITASNNTTNGIHLSLSSNNRLSGITASNNNSGITLLSSSNNKLSGITASNNLVGVSLSSTSPNNTLLKVTAPNNYTGVQIRSSSNTLSGIAVPNNNTGVRMDISSSSNNTLSAVAASNNGSYSIVLSDSSYNYFTGLLLVDNDYYGDCYVSGGTHPGLVDNVYCSIEGSSDATLWNYLSVANSFVAKVTSDDTVNTSDANGSAYISDFTLPFDWTDFENRYRAWGRDGSFPSASIRGWIGCTYRSYKTSTICSAQSGEWYAPARIWDWSLLNADTVIRNTLALPTGNDTLTHLWNAADATACTDIADATWGANVCDRPGYNDQTSCESASGDWADNKCYTIMLRNTVEIQGDSIGNDNTLCETNETCLYTPNIGSYQGHGNLISAGSISTGGTLENIILMKYETNGY